MNIQVGEIYLDKMTGNKSLYPNKTRKYLLPCLQEYGKDFIKKLEGVFKVAIGVGDIIISNRGIKHEKHLFILLESNIAPKFFINFLDWIREQPMFEDDYVFDNIQKSTFHMIIIKLPEKYYDSFKSFKLGDYSKMYKREDIDKYFKEHPNIQKILIKDHNYRITFAQKVNKRFGSEVKPEDMTGELDFKPDKANEIFNYHLRKK